MRSQIIGSAFFLLTPDRTYPTLLPTQHLAVLYNTHKTHTAIVYSED